MFKPLAGHCVACPRLCNSDWSWNSTRKNKGSLIICLTLPFSCKYQYLETLHLLCSFQSSDTLQAAYVAPDMIPPKVNSFTFNVSTGVITFMFSEVVNVTGINPFGIVLQSAVTEPEYSHRLTGGTSSTSRPAQVFGFTLTDDDINFIKQFPEFATNESNTYLAAELTTVSDMSGNSLVAIPQSSAQQSIWLAVSRWDGKCNVKYESEVECEGW